MANALYLIDGSAFAYRSFFAIRGLTDSQGRPTNAVFGFTRVLLKILREEDPSHIAVVFDAPGKTFREEMYADYKATRKETPEDLIAQMPLIDKLVEAFDIPLLRMPGYEADDIMGTLAKRAASQGMDTVIVTGDKDMLQLIDDHIVCYDPNKGDLGARYHRQDVIARFGAPPEHVIDALALIGDASDNVPGVTGIGPKTAKGLLEKYQSLEGIYEHIGELKGKQRERLEAERDQALLSRKLVTIDTNVDVDISIEDCQRQELNRRQLADMFGELEFHSLLEEFMPDASEREDLDYKVIMTEDALDAVIAEMRQAGEFSVDTETTSVDPMRARLVGVSLSCKACTGYYIPVSHVHRDDLATDRELYPPEDQLPPELVIQRLRPLLEDPAIGKIGHNIKYDLVVFARHGSGLEGITCDTMVASYLTDASRLRHNLDEVSLHYLKRKLIPISDLIGKGSKAITFDNVPIDRACAYACEDADIAWRLAEVLRPKLREGGLEDLFEKVELPLIGVLARMEMAGVAIDGPLFESMQREVESGLAALQGAIYEAAGETFQINSPKQLQGILFEKLGLKPIRKTKTGFSTDMEVLEQLALEHDLPAKILEYRTLEKLRGTYIEALPKLVHPETGRIHTSFNQAVAATGRLSSSDPNLQNIPVRTDIGRRIRQGFIPGREKPVGKKFISADYSQIELRILAHLSHDVGLQEAFERDMDIHTDTAARIFDVMPELVDPLMRRQAKAVNFGVVYGISPYGLARNLNISTKEAARFIEEYFAQYPGVQQWIRETIAEAKESGYVTTMLGRRRYVSGLDSNNKTTRNAAERIAINTPVQGSAADAIKLAMLRLDQDLAGTDARLLLQVHDELLVEAPEDEAEAVAATMRSVMESAVELTVPLKVDVGIGNNWAEAH